MFVTYRIYSKCYATVCMLSFNPMEIASWWVRLIDDPDLKLLTLLELDRNFLYVAWSNWFQLVFMSRSSVMMFITQGSPVVRQLIVSVNPHFD